MTRSARYSNGLLAAAFLLLAILVAGCAADSPDEVGVKGAPTDWDVVAFDPGSADLEILVWVGSSSCDVFEGFDIEEGPDQVVLVALDTPTSTRAGGCTADLISSRQNVTLRAPPGAKTLVGCRPDAPVARSPIGPITDCHTIVASDLNR